MPWFWRTPEAKMQERVLEVNPVWLSVEDRLAKMAKSQLELNRQAEEIKSITTSIVITFGISEKTTEIQNERRPC
jgi:hypothetical protein